MSLSLKAIQAKNSLDDGGIWLTLFTLYSPKLNLTFRVVPNTSDVEWNGNTYTAMDVKIGEFKEAIKGKLPSLDLQVTNVQRILQGYIEQDEDFGSGWDVSVDILYEETYDKTSTIVTTATPELSLSFISLGVTCTEEWVTIPLGIENPIREQCPHRKFSPNSCQAIFKDADTGCPYTGVDTVCAKTLEDCKSKFGETNNLPFLGFPGIPVGHGVYKI